MTPELSPEIKKALEDAGYTAVLNNERTSAIDERATVADETDFWTDQKSAQVNQAESVVAEQESLQELVKEAVKDQLSFTSGWESRGEIKFVVECPSGQRCLLKRLDAIDLINAGILDEMDFFTKALIPREFDAAGNPVFDNQGSNFWDALKDPEKRLRFFSLLNKVIETAVVNPVIYDDGTEIVTNDRGKKIVVQGTSVFKVGNSDAIKLEDGTVHIFGENEARTSEIDFADKMHIFSEVNKPLSQIRPFREETTSVAGMGTE